MSNNLNKLKLTELVFLAQNVTYKKPEKEFKDFSEDAILYEAVNYGLKSEAQIHSLYDACKLCPPIKLLAKDRIRKYVLQFMK